MSDALIGYGTLVQTQVGVLWRTIAEVRAISPPDIERDSIDTSHENGPDEWRTNMPGSKHVGELALTINLIPGGATIEELLAEMDDRLIRARRVLYPNGKAMLFSAFLTGVEQEPPIEGVMLANIKFQSSGSFTMT